MRRFSALLLSRLRLSLLCLLAAGLLGACLAGRQPEGNTTVAEAPVWPQHPQTARIRWLQEFRTPQESGLKPGFWQRLGALAFGEKPQSLTRPYGILTDPEGRIYIADTGGASLEIIDLAAGRYRRLGREGETTLLSPIGLARDRQGRIYVTDSEARAIYRLAGPGQPLVPWIVTGLQRPTGIVYNPVNDLLYVSDTTAHQIVAFDPHGVEQLRFGGRGSGSGQLNYPTDLTVDRAGNLIVTDALNARLQIFSPAGASLAVLGRAGDIPGTLSKPKGVAIDSDGHIYICDGLQDRVQIFDAAGTLLLAFGQTGQGRGEFQMPSGIWIDARDRIHVVDAFNQRVQIFQYLPEPNQGK